jgi:alkylated DNA nucleotide flippase Atl1
MKKKDPENAAEAVEEAPKEVSGRKVPAGHVVVYGTRAAMIGGRQVLRKGGMAILPAERAAELLKAGLVTEKA